MYCLPSGTFKDALELLLGLLPLLLLVVDVADDCVGLESKAGDGMRVGAGDAVRGVVFPPFGGELFAIILLLVLLLFILLLLPLFGVVVSLLLLLLLLLLLFTSLSALEELVVIFGEGILSTLLDITINIQSSIQNIVRRIIFSSNATYGYNCLLGQSRGFILGNLNHLFFVLLWFLWFLLFLLFRSFLGG